MHLTKRIYLALVISVIIVTSSNKILAVNAHPSDLTFKLWASNTGNNSITLKWTPIAGTAKFNIFRSGPHNSQYIHIASAYGTTYIDKDITPSASYSYIIKAAGSADISAFSPTITTPPVKSKYVLGFTTKYSTSDTSSYNSIVNNSSVLDGIATYTYTTDNYGNLSGIAPSEQITYANKQKIKPLALVTNNFSPVVAKAVLENSTSSQNLINNIIIQLEDNNYHGVNIDFEGLFYYDRSYFTSFLKNLYTQLHPIGYEVTVDVPAKTADSLTDNWNGAYDYSSISQNADKVIIMTYDEHYSGGNAGPIASIAWVSNVVDYTLKMIPEDKIMLGAAAYGYDWSSAGTKAYSINGIYSLASSLGKQILWDDFSKSPYFSYTASGIKHYIWFENSTSLGYKLDIVNNRNLAGIAIWRLGSEDEDYWNMIKLKLNK